MVVVAIVGVLSSVALPNLLSNRDRAEAQSQVGGLTAYANQCQNNINTENPSDIPYSKGLFETANMNSTTTGESCGTLTNNLYTKPTGAVSFKNKTPYTKPENLKGIRCGFLADGTPSVNQGTEKTCTITVEQDGSTVTGKWS